MAVNDTQIHIASVDKSIPEWAYEKTLSDLTEIARTHMLYATGKKPPEDKNLFDIGQKKEDKRTEQITIGLERLRKDFSIKSIVTGLIRGGASFEKIFKDAFVDLAKVLVDKLGTFGAALGVIVVGSVALIKNMKEMHGMFLEIFDAGVSLNGSFIGMVRGAAEARMSVADFASALTNHSVAIQTLVTDMGSGSEAFAKLRSEVGRNLYQYDQLGLSIADINDYMGSYLETQRLMGMRDNMTTLQRRNAITEYIVNLTQLSQMTGKHRKELESQMKERMQDTQWVAFLQSIPKEMRDNMQKAVGVFSASSADLGQLFQEFVRFGNPMNDNTRKLAVMLGEAGIDLESFASRIKRGEKFTSEAMQDQLLAMGKSAQIIMKTQGQTLSNMSLIDQDFEGVIQALIGMSSVVDKRNSKFASALDSLLASWDQLKADLFAPFGKVFASFLERMNQSRGLFTSIAVVLKDSMRSLANLLERYFVPIVEEHLIPILGWLGDKFGELIVWVSKAVDSGHFWEMLGDKAVEGVKGLISLIGEALVGAIWDAVKTVAYYASGRVLIDEAIKRGPGVAEDIRGAFGIEEPSGPTKARGGIATVASVFGEKGPEAAIPLDSGQRIPIAEMKGNFGQKEIKETNKLLKDILNRLETQNSTTSEVATNIKRLESVTKSNSRSVF